MEQTQPKAAHYALFGALTVMFAAVAALAFAGWLSYGAEIVLTMSESALSYCF